MEKNVLTKLFSLKIILLLIFDNSIYETNIIFYSNKSLTYIVRFINIVTELARLFPIGLDVS